MRRNFLFAKAYFFFIATISLTGWALFVLVFDASVQPKTHHPKALKSTLRLVRKNVRKEVWQMDEAKRRHHQVAGAFSSFFILPEKKQFKIIEELKKLESSFEQNDGSTTSLSADRSLLLPSSLFMKNFGHVKIEGVLDGKPTVALADKMIIDFQKKLGEMQGTPTQRVLFYQDGLEMSSEKLIFDQGIQSVGVTHFSFDGKERDIIEKFITKKP
jgi:hypothetical protein